MKSETFLQEIDNRKILLMENLIANEKTKLLMRMGLTFFSKNKKAMDMYEELDKSINLKKLISSNIYTKSKFGGDVIFLTRNMLKQPIIRRVPIVDTNGVVNVWGNPEIIVIEQVLNYGNVEYQVKSYYDKKQVVNKIYNKENGKLISIDEFNAKVIPSMRMEASWKHNFGFVPCWLTYNKEIVENYGETTFVYSFTSEDTKTSSSSEFLKCSDTYDISDLVNIINNTFKNFVINNEATRPWVIKNGTSQRNIKKRMIINQTTGKPELVWDAENWMEAHANILYTARIGADTKLQLSTQTLTSFIDNNKQLIELAFYLAGIQLRISNATQKTTKETKENKRRTIDTIEEAREISNRQWKEIIFAYMLANGIDLSKDKEWFFKINRNTELARDSIVDEDIKTIQVGVSTPIDMMMDLYNLTEQDANEKWAKNEKWFKKNKFMVVMKETGSVSGVKGASVPNSKNIGDNNDDSEE